MLGYNFYLYYNTTILDATAYSSYYPFEYALPSWIDDAKGEVQLSYSYPPPEFAGLYTYDPYAIARIDFTVDELGTSLFDITGSVVSDIYGAPIAHEVVDGLFANVPPPHPHDVAVTDIAVNQTRDITPGQFVSIDVTVANQGFHDETLNVTAKVDTTVVDNKTESLVIGASRVVHLYWNTTGYAFGIYHITAEITPVQGETDTADNTLPLDDVAIVGKHDIATTDVKATPTNVAKGELIKINVTVANQGNFTESFGVTTSYGYLEGTKPPGVTEPIIIGTKSVSSLTSGTSKTLTFTFDTKDVGINYPTYWYARLQINANASIVQYETTTNTPNNKRTMAGDVTVWPERATLEAPTVKKKSLEPGQTFYINITIVDVEKMYGFDFFLYYNTTVLTATSYSNCSPFTVKKVAVINDAEGYVHVAYTTANKTVYLTATYPKTILRIDFDVTEWGTSPLDIREPKILDIMTEEAKTREIALVVVDGSFANTLSLHDIEVRLKTPSQAIRGDSYLLNATVYNFGSSNETNVELQWLINGTQVSFETIPELISEESLTVSYSWHPAVEGIYNITAFAPPLTGEDLTANNNATSIVNVRRITPTVSFTISPEVRFEGKTVTFDATASSEGSTIVSYRWSFDDGNITTVTVASIDHIYTKGTYTVNLTVTDARGESNSKEETLRVFRHDLAVVSITPSATEVTLGQSISINVTVQNLGDFGNTRTFNVTLYYDTTIIDIENVTNPGLAPGESKTLTFSWDTEDVSLGDHTLKAKTTTISDETNTTNNELTYAGTVSVVTHDIAITLVTVSLTEATIGETLSINVTVVNQGTFTETFDVTAYYSNTIIGTETVTNLAPGGTQTPVFNWDTTGLNPGGYIIKAVASTVTGETDTTDNTRIGTTVTLKVRETPTGIPLQYILAGVGVAIVIIALSFYLLRVRKPKTTPT